MPFSMQVPMIDGSNYTIKRLLAKAESNTKTAKSDKAELGFMTLSLSLAPAFSSGFNLCTSASHACISGCLNTAGLAGVFPRTILPGRIARARAFKMQKDVFLTRLHKEISDGEKLAARKGKQLCIRLNVLSDVFWERECPTLFSDHPQVTYYDYSKHNARMHRFLRGEFPPNYSLTFSRSETNEADCLEILRKGGNVAVVFDTKPKQALPQKWKGFRVVNGDLTDLRFLDPRGVVVGLRAKGKARKDFDSGFVVKAPARKVGV